MYLQDSYGRTQYVTMSTYTPCTTKAMQHAQSVEKADASDIASQPERSDPHKVQMGVAECGANSKMSKYFARLGHES